MVREIINLVGHPREELEKPERLLRVLEPGTDYLSHLPWGRANWNAAHRATTMSPQRRDTNVIAAIDSESHIRRSASAATRSAVS